VVFIINDAILFMQIYGITILLSICIAVISVGILILLFRNIKEKKEKFMVNVDIEGVLSNQRDAVTKWAAETERKMKSLNMRMKIKRFIILKGAITFCSFVWSLVYFKNFAATLMFTISMFLIPDYIIYLLEYRSREREADQLVRAMRIFMQEYLQHYQLMRAFAAIYNNVQKPLGVYFGDAYYELLARVPVDSVLSTLSTKISNYYGKMFIHLIYQIKEDSTVINLLPGLLMKHEESIEMGRNNTSALAGERLLSFTMAISPLPIYMAMKSVVPEIEYFVVNTMLGRILITMIFVSLFLFMVMDRALGRVE